MLYFPFFLKSQQFSLKQRLGLIPYNNPLIKVKVGLHDALTEDRGAYSMYALSTKSWPGLFKSFLPWTTQYNNRIKCAYTIANSNAKIDALLEHAKVVIQKHLH